MSDALTKIKRQKTFGRHARPESRRIMRGVRHELRQKPLAEIEGLGIKLSKMFEFAYSFGKPGEAGQLYRQYRRKFGAEKADPPFVEFLVKTGAFERALELSQGCLDRQPENPGYLYTQIRVLFLAGNPKEALDTIEQHQTHLARLPVLMRQRLFDMIQSAPRPMAAGLRNTAGFKRYLAQIPAAPDPIDNTRIRTYCISLGKAYRRYQTTEHFLNCAKVDLRHVEAVYGAALPEQVVAQIAQMGDLKGAISPGELGCSLSHLRTWERIAKEATEDAYCLVTEDDARFIHGQGRGLDQIIAAARKADAGFVFVNARASESFPRRPDFSDLEVIPLETYRKEHQSQRPSTNTGFGTDGYLIRGDMAATLAKHWLALGNFMALDWQLYLLAQRDLDSIGRRRVYDQGLKKLRAYRAEHPEAFHLPAFVSSQPIIAEMDFGFSSVNSES